MVRRRTSLALTFSLLAIWPLGNALAQDATPVARHAQLDLAALALDQHDLPKGYRQLRYDDEGYTPGERINAIQFGGEASDAELAETQIVSFYSSTFKTEDESSWIYVYLSEFPNEEAVEAGFAFFEDESRWTFEGETYQDLPGPAAGMAPKEITAGTYAYPDDPSFNGQTMDATFRVGRLLVGVSVVMYGENAPVPELSLMEDLAGKLERRINAVMSGTVPPGIDSALPGLILPLFATWPWPGNSLEGYKSAEEFLGSDPAGARFVTEYRSGYAAFASVTSTAAGMVHDPPYIDIEIAEFASPEAAQGVLAIAGELPDRHYGNAVMHESVPDPAVPGSDAALAFRTDRPATSIEDSLHLTGFKVVYVLGTRIVVVSVLTDALASRFTADAIEAAALDLAAQQADCLRADQPCASIRVPEAFVTTAPIVASPAP